MVGSKSTQTRVVGIITDKVHPTFIFKQWSFYEEQCRNASRLLLSLLLLFVYFLAYVPLFLQFYSCFLYLFMLLYNSLLLIFAAGPSLLIVYRLRDNDYLLIYNSIIHYNTHFYSYALSLYRNQNYYSNYI